MKTDELDCLHRISKVISAEDCSFGDTIQRIVDLLSGDRLACIDVRIFLEGGEFRSHYWKESVCKEFQAITLRGDRVGSVEICYPDNGRMKHGRVFLETIALMLAEVTGRQRTEESLRKGEERFRQIVENAPSSYFRAGKNGLWEYVNKEWERTHSLSRDDVVGTSMRLVNVHRDRQRLRNYRQRALLGETIKSQFDVMKEGKPRYFTIYMQPVRDEDGVIGVEGFIDDITDQKLAAEARAEQAASAARADELRRSRRRVTNIEESLRKEMAQRLHGTVQNRLIVVMHGLNELCQVPLPEEVLAEVERLGEILKELLDKHVRPISHQLYPSILRQGMVPALKSLADQFQTVLTVESEFSESLQKGERADRNLIPEQTRIAVYRIAEEAFANVLKHADASIVKLKIDLAPDGILTISLRDNGRGFEVFGGKSGLGTSLMSDYAGLVDGNCEIISSPGEGTEVVATIRITGPSAKQ